MSEELTGRSVHLLGFDRREHAAFREQHPSALADKIEAWAIDLPSTLDDFFSPNGTVSQFPFYIFTHRLRIAAKQGLTDLGSFFMARGRIAVADDLSVRYEQVVQKTKTWHARLKDAIENYNDPETIDDSEWEQEADKYRPFPHDSYTDDQGEDHYRPSYQERVNRDSDVRNITVDIIAETFSLTRHIRILYKFGGANRLDQTSRKGTSQPPLTPMEPCGPIEPNLFKWGGAHVVLSKNDLLIVHSVWDATLRMKHVDAVMDAVYGHDHDKSVSLLNTARSRLNNKLGTLPGAPSFDKEGDYIVFSPGSSPPATYK